MSDPREEVEEAKKNRLALEQQRIELERERQRKTLARLAKEKEDKTQEVRTQATTPQEVIDRIEKSAEITKKIVQTTPIYKVAKSVREDTLKPVLKRLQSTIEEAETKSNYPTRAEIDQAFQDGKYRSNEFAPKNLDEALNRITFMAGTALKGSIKEVTLPISWGLSPPTSEAQRSGEFLGAIATPSPIDYVFTKIVSKLSLAKNGKKLVQKILSGGQLTDEEVDTFEYLVRKGQSRSNLETFQDTLDIKSFSNPDESRKAVRKLKEYFDEVNMRNLDDIGKAARETDETLSTIAGNNWDEGVDLGKYTDKILKGVNHDETRAGIRAAKQYIKEQNDILSGLVDIDPNTGNLTTWGSMSQAQKDNLIKTYQELLKFWEKNPQLYTAGASYKPSYIVELEDAITDLGYRPQELDELLNAFGDDFTGLSPAALVPLLEKLNDPTDIAPDFGFEDNTIERYRDIVEQSLAELEDSTNTFMEDFEEQVDQIQEQEEEDIGPLPEPERPEPPAPIETEEEVEEEEEIPITVTEQVEEELPLEEEKTVMPPRDRGSFEKKIPKLVLGSKGSYQVEFQYGTGAREFHTVEADNYIMALDLGIRAKKQNLVPIEVELTKK